MSLALLSLAAGALAGGAAGTVAGFLGRPRLAPALVLFCAMLLEGLSLVSKELHGRAAGLAGVGVLAAALTGLVVQARSGGIARALGALVCLPAGGWLAARLAEGSGLALLGSCAPLVWLAATRGDRRATHRAAGLVLAGVLVAAQLGPRAPRRAGFGPPPPPTAARPSIVVLVIDTLRADALDPAGALAAFAREGVEFRQCVAAAPWTLPAVSSLLTGLLPSQHGAVDATTPLAEDVQTLAELLRAEGYATAAFTGGAFVGPAHRLDQGFQVFETGGERRFAPFALRTPLVWRLAKNRYLPLRALVRAVDEYRGLEGVLEHAHAWAERAGSGPKLLLLHTYQVHDYYLYDPDVDDPVRALRPPPSAEFARRCSVHPRELARAAQSDLDYFRALYQGRVAAVERLFPSLVSTLTPFVGADAVWVVTADHGEGFDAATGRVHHGGRLHEDLLRVPLLVRAPGRLAPRQRVEASVRSVDVLPTLLELVGVAIPPDLAGVSLLPALRGEGAFPTSAFAEERARGFELLALRRDGWKWMGGPSSGQLFHLAEDPGEARPIEGAPPPELAVELADFPRRYPPRERAEVELDAATLEHLRSLGYVE